MPAWLSAVLDVAPWAVVTLFAISKVYRLALAWMVRTSSTDMIVKEHPKSFEVRRGEANPPSEPPQPRGVDPPAPDDEPASGR